MSDSIYVGKKAKSIKASPSLDGYSKVVIIVGEDDSGDQIIYEAGDNTGATLEVENPWGTQQMANDMLARIQGYAYKPITASGILLDPAVELGDGITVGANYSVIASQSIRFDSLGASDIEAPDNGDLEHELPLYEPASERKVKRKIATVSSSFRVEIDSITAEIQDFESDVDTQFTLVNGAITSKITSSEAQTLISQGLNSITLSAVGGTNQSTITISANGVVVDSVVARFTNIVADSVVANASITSPNIYGGVFYNSAGTAHLTVGNDLNFYSAITSSSALFTIYDDVGSVRLKGYNKEFLAYTDLTSRATALGNWQFSGPIILSSGVQYGTQSQMNSITPTNGRIFFVRN